MSYIIKYCKHCKKDQSHWQNFVSSRSGKLALILHCRECHYIICVGEKDTKDLFKEK